MPLHPSLPEILLNSTPFRLFYHSTCDTTAPVPRPAALLSWLSHEGPNTWSSATATSHILTVRPTVCGLGRIATMASLASKQESIKIFEKLKSKPANKVCAHSMLSTCWPGLFPLTQGL